MSSYQFELAFCQYIRAVFKSLYDNAHHKDFNYLPKDEKVIGGDGMMHLKAVTPVTREEIYQLHSKHYASGQKVTLIHFRKIGLDCVDIKVRPVNGEEETTVRVVNTLSNSQVVLSREIDESIPLKVLELNAQMYYTRGKRSAPIKQICRHLVTEKRRDHNHS